MAVTNAVDHLIEVAQERLREFGITLKRETPETSTAIDGGIDAVVTLARGPDEARYGVVAKDLMTLTSLAHRTTPPSADPVLVVAHRISRRSARAFRESGVQFVDALGNTFITFGNVLVEVQGRAEPAVRGAAISPPEARPPQPANIFSPRRSQVVLALLAWPELRTAKVRDIATAAGTSVGQAHDALSELERAGFLVPVSRRLSRTEELLDYWAAAYPAGLGRRLDVARYHGDPSKTFRSPDSGAGAYLSGESADGIDIVRPATLTIYVDDLDPRLPILNRWTASPDLAPNVFVRHKFWTPPEVSESSASTNAPWPLVYADLMATGDSRLRDAARAWRTRHAEPDGV